MYRRLFPLALATFAVGTDGFVIAGLLPALSADLDVGISAAGQLVTSFALTFAVSAPLLGAMTSRLDRRTALLIGLGVFVVGNACTALAPTYDLVLGARIVTGVGAGLIGSTAFSAAAAMSSAENRGRALAFVMGGLAVATALGLPLGTLIGALDWRITLWAVAALGLMAAAGTITGIPSISLPEARLRDRLAPLRSPRILGLLTVTLTTLAGAYVLYTYIASALENATGGSTPLLTVVLLAWGLGGVVGNAVAGTVTDRWAPQPFLIISLIANAAVLAISPLVVDTMASAIVWAAIWGICLALPVVPQQHRLSAHSPGATPILLGLNSSAIYIGIAVGGALGGILQDWTAPHRLGLAGAVLTGAALVMALAVAPKPDDSGEHATADTTPATGS